MPKRLRSGYTTGACAAAAAKAALLHLLTGKPQAQVEIPFPEGFRRTFTVQQSELGSDKQGNWFFATIIKDAGDDPDVTNGAEIGAKVILPASIQTLDSLPVEEYHDCSIYLKAGPGVGLVTKPGLAVPVGDPAINPIPRRMIAEAVGEALAEGNDLSTEKPKEDALLVEISVTDGEQLATKTLNARLGIVGGLSILGTTGIVRPISAEAWTATIDASLSVANECGCQTVVLSTGRTSEKAVQTMLSLADEAYCMMGDYLEYALKAAGQFSFQNIVLAAMWAKVLKGAMHTPQTHVRHGALEISQAVDFLKRLGTPRHLRRQIQNANTAREILLHLEEDGQTELIRAVCLAYKQYGESVSKLPVSVCLVGSAGRVIEHV